MGSIIVQMKCKTCDIRSAHPGIENKGSDCPLLVGQPVCGISKGIPESVTLVLCQVLYRLAAGMELRYIYPDAAAFLRVKWCTDPEEQRDSRSRGPPPQMFAILKKICEHISLSYFFKRVSPSGLQRIKE